MKLKVIILGIAMALAAAPSYARAVGFAGGGSAHGGGFAHSGPPRATPAPGLMNHGFIPPIAPGPMNEGFIPPLVGSHTVTGHRFGFHRHAFRHRHAFGHRFAFHRHGFRDFAGFGFGDLFLNPPVADLEMADPEEPAGPNPSEPSAGLAEEQDQEPLSAHIVQFHRPQHAETSAGRHEGSGKVVVMRPGFQDEVVTVLRDARGG